MLTQEGQKPNSLSMVLQLFAQPNITWPFFPNMKILLVHNRYRSTSPSGENRVVDQEHAALVDAGHTVERYERLSDDIVSSSHLQKLRVAASTVWNPGTTRDLRRTLVRFRPEVAHIHNVYPLLSPSVLVACRQEAVPTVVTLHNYRLICPSGDCFRSGRVCFDCVGRHPGPALQHACYRGSRLATLPWAVATVAEGRLWRSAPSAYVFLSEAQRTHFSILDLPPERCFVKPNLVPSARPAGIKHDRVVYIGRLTESKGLPVLMRAWDLFEGNRTGAKPGGLELVIAGSGPLESRVRAWASDRSAVDFVGLLPREDCARLLSTARAAVVPSEWLEPFGLAVVEAFALGVAVIAPSHAVFPELITDGVDGLLYPPGGADALASILRSVADSPDWFNALGNAARDTYQRRFRTGDNVARLEEIYQFAIRSRR